MYRHRPTKKGQKTKLAAALAGVVLLAVTGLAVTLVPGLENSLYSLLGISSEGVKLDAGVESPTGVHFIDVGQGDAVLLEQDGEFALVDAGPPEASDELARYLESAGVKQLKYVFMTHPHADHIGGMETVISMFGTENFMLPDFNGMELPTTITFLTLLESLEKSGAKVETVEYGNEYILGNGKIRVVQSGVPEYDDYNMISTSLMFEAEGIRYLSTGDAEKPNEKAMLENGEELSANIYKAAHHGSKTSNTKDFIAKVSPQLIVISCAENNSYGHPNQSVMERFEQSGAVILNTAEKGSIVVRPDGSGGLAYGVRKTA